MRKIFFFIILLALWQVSGFLNPDIVNLISKPTEIILSLWQLIIEGIIFIDILASLQRVLVGFCSAAIIAVILALFSGYFKSFGYYLKPLVEILRPIPPIAWIPIAILLLGLGDPSAYFIVFIGAFFPIFTNTYFGVISMPEIYKNVARSFEIKNSTFLIKILFFYSLPYIFTGLKIGIGMAWMSVIAAELIGAQSGLGYFIQLNRLLLRMDNVILGMILIGLIGFLLSKTLSFAEKMAMPWVKK